MNILACSEHYSADRGGSANYTRSLLAAMVKAGHDVTLVTETSSDVLDGKTGWTKHNGCEVHAAGHSSLSRWDRRALVRAISSVTLSLIKKCEFDVVHVCGGHLLAPLLQRVPEPAARVWTIYNVPPREYAFTAFESCRPLQSILKRAYFGSIRLLRNRTLKRASYDRLICISDQTKAAALKEGAAPSRTVSITLGVDTAVFRPAVEGPRRPGPLRILCVAGLVPHKGQMELVEAVGTLVRPVFPGVELTLIGAARDRRYELALRARINALGLGQSCRLRGHIPEGDLLTAYHESDLYVQPSHEEGFCLAALEAASCGLPLIGTEAGAMGQYVREGDAGMVIHAATPKAIGEAILALAQKRRPDAFALHRFVVEHYSWNTAASRTAACYREAVTARAKHA